MGGEDYDGMAACAGSSKASLDPYSGTKRPLADEQPGLGAGSGAGLGAGPGARPLRPGQRRSCLVAQPQRVGVLLPLTATGRLALSQLFECRQLAAPAADDDDLLLGAKLG